MFSIYHATFNVNKCALTMPGCFGDTGSVVHIIKVHGCIVGWVKRSGTHRESVSNQKWWVSLLFTHPTKPDYMGVYSMSQNKSYPVRCSKTILCTLLLFSTYSMALEIGIGVVDITPDVTAYKVPMAGYGSRMGRPATGAHDPLHAKVLYLTDGAQRMALITVDLRSSTPEFKGQIVSKTSDLGLTHDNVFVAASHTHDGPSMYPEKFWQMQFGKYDPAIVDIMTTAIAKAVYEAAASVQPVRMGYAAVLAEGLARNRRWGYDTEKREADGESPVVEPRLTVIRFDGMNGDCLALTVHFAAHPTILGADNMLLSAEWPGVLQRELERAFPGSKAFYLNGAEGDQSPVADLGADDFERIENYGKKLAALAAELAATVETKPDMPIGFAYGTPELPPLAFPEGAERKYQAYAKAAQEALPKQAPLQVLRIGPIALAGLPGEPIMEVGQSVENKLKEMGAEHPLTVGLANDYIGYIVNEKEYAHGGYEVESRSYYGPGLGRFVVEQMEHISPMNMMQK